jgi:hypothetical protein
MDRKMQDVVVWTGREWEFKFVDRKKAAKLWGIQKKSQK